MSKKNAVETNKMKPLSWAKARRIRGRGGGHGFYPSFARRKCGSGHVHNL